MTFTLSFLWPATIVLLLQGSLWLSYWFSLGWFTRQNAQYLNLLSLLASLISLVFYQILLSQEKKKWSILVIGCSIVHFLAIAGSIYLFLVAFFGEPPAIHLPFIN